MATTSGLSAWEKYFKGKGDFDCLLKRDVKTKQNQLEKQKHQYQEELP